MEVLSKAERSTVETTIPLCGRHRETIKLACHREPPILAASARPRCGRLRSLPEKDRKMLKSHRQEYQTASHVESGCAAAAEQSAGPRKARSHECPCGVMWPGKSSLRGFERSMAGAVRCGNRPSKLLQASTAQRRRSARADIREAVPADRLEN